MHSLVDCGTINNGQNMKVTKVPTKTGMDNKDMIYMK